MTDFNHIDVRHAAINAKLEGWGRWVTQTDTGGSVSPMFRQYRSHAWQWEAPQLHAKGDPNEHMEIEKSVVRLPEKNRAAVQWAYAFHWVPVSAIRKELGMTRSALGQLLVDSRDMLINRTRQEKCSTIRA